MIFGVSAEGLSVTNGFGVLSYEDLQPGLESPSLLQIRASDVLDCSPFDAKACDAFGPEWVAQEVSKQLLELRAGKSEARFVYIPAAYRAGITVFVRKGSPAAQELRDAPELPNRPGD